MFFDHYRMKLEIKENRSKFEEFWKLKKTLVKNKSQRRNHKEIRK